MWWTKCMLTRIDYITSFSLGQVLHLHWECKAGLLNALSLMIKTRITHSWKSLTLWWASPLLFARRKCCICLKMRFAGWWNGLTLKKYSPWTPAKVPTVSLLSEFFQKGHQALIMSPRGRATLAGICWPYILGDSMERGILGWNWTKDFGWKGEKPKKRGPRRA